MPYSFISDTTSGACPEVLEILKQANEGYEASYGEDSWTAKACDLIRGFFETDCEVFFVFNGTASNSLALASLCHPHHGIVCHQMAHLYQDECGAPGFFSGGAGLLLAGGAHGKLDLQGAASVIESFNRHGFHSSKPHAISITQATELGTVYKQEEIAAFGDLAKRHGMRLHMDGARFFNACVHLNASPKDMTWKAGVDVLCLGGTKNGMMLNEAVVFFNKELAVDFEYRCKQSGQLGSKLRFLAAPWVAALQNNVWHRNASHANASTQKLAAKLASIPGTKILMPVEANAVFIELSSEAHAKLLKKGWHFYPFIGDHGYRLMCSWKTTDQEIETLVADVRAAI